MRNLLILSLMLISTASVSAWTEEWVNDFQKKIVINASGVKVNQNFYPWNKETVTETDRVSVSGTGFLHAECRIRTQLAQKIGEQVVLVDTYRSKPTFLWGVFCRFMTNVYTYSEPFSATQTILSTNEQGVLVRQTVNFLDAVNRPPLSVNDLLNPQLLSKEEWVKYLEPETNNRAVMAHQEIYRRVSQTPAPTP